jgi:hypothetical protein
MPTRKHSAPAGRHTTLADVLGLRGARLAPGREAVRALGAVAIIAFLLSGVAAWRARPIIQLPRAPSSPAVAWSQSVAVGAAVRPAMPP